MVTKWGVNKSVKIFTLTPSSKFFYFILFYFLRLRTLLIGEEFGSSTPFVSLLDSSPSITFREPTRGKKKKKNSFLTFSKNQEVDSRTLDWDKRYTLHSKALKILDFENPLIGEENGCSSNLLFFLLTSSPFIIFEESMIGKCCFLN